MPDLLGVLLEPLAYDFMRAGLVAAVVVGLTASVLSCLLVVRAQALLGDAISHAVLLGVAVGYLVGETAGIFPGALLVALATGTLITYVDRHSAVKLDAAMGICFTATFALGLAIISVADPRGIDLFHVLFGNVLGVSAGDLWLTAGAAAVVLAVVAVLFRAFHLWSFDPVAARALGLRVGALQYVFTGLLSATIVASLQAVGLVLVVAMLITPGATALLVAARLSTMMLAAGLVGVVSGAGGLYASYYVDVASGPAIVLVASALFALAFLASPRRGLLVTAARRRRARRRGAALATPAAGSAEPGAATAGDGRRPGAGLGVPPVPGPSVPAGTAPGAPGDRSDGAVAALAAIAARPLAELGAGEAGLVAAVHDDGGTGVAAALAAAAALGLGPARVVEVVAPAAPGRSTVVRVGGGEPVALPPGVGERVLVRELPAALSGAPAASGAAAAG